MIQPTSTHYSHAPHHKTAHFTHSQKHEIATFASPNQEIIPFCQHILQIIHDIIFPILAQKMRTSAKNMQYILQKGREAFSLIASKGKGSFVYLTCHLNFFSQIIV